MAQVVAMLLHLREPRKSGRAVSRRSTRCLFLTISFLFLIFAKSSVAQTRPTPRPEGSPGSSALNSPLLEARVSELLRKMTLEEKIGQLVQYSAGQPTGPGTGRTDYEDMIAKGQIGALFNIVTAKRTNAYQRIAVEESRLHIPLLFGLDVIHGLRTVFPIPLGLASTWDPALVERTARVAGREASAAGIRWTFSPMVDIARDARWGRMAEGAGEDPYVGAAMARAYVRGYQGARLDDPESIAACAKHFVAYGAAEGGRDYNTVELSERTLRQVYLPPFQAAVNAGVASLMSAFNSLNGLPASANPFTLKKILKEEWGFHGLVDSDWTAVAELVNHGVARDGAIAARKAFLAGVDMDMASSLYHDHLAKLARSGEIPQAAVDDAVRRVLRVKFALGLFEHPYADEKRENTATLSPDNIALAREAAERSFVLLKNSAGAAGVPLLPLSPDTKTIALIGPLADDAGDMLGSWAGQGRPEDVVTLYAALSQRIGTTRIRYAKGSAIIEGSDEQIAEAVQQAQQSDLVILALGENAPEMTGEAASRAHLGLPGRQQLLLEAIAATGKPVVLILFSGRPLTLPWTFEHVPTVLAAWFPGVQAGPALVGTLFGESMPSGRLVVSWPRSVGQEPLYYNALSTGRPAGDTDLSRPPPKGTEKYVSRYIDEQNSPQFPFGFGLSYTSFRYGQPQISVKEVSARALNQELRLSKRQAGGSVSVSAEITNTGAREGEETVQLYVRLQGTSVAQPVRALKGFQRIRLAPGETRKVTFNLSADSFSFWNDQNKFEVEPALATIWISPDSARGSAVTLEIGK